MNMTRSRQKIKLVFNVLPLAKQSTRFTKSGIMYTDPKVKKYEKNIQIEGLSQRPKGFKKMTGAIIARVSYCFLPPASLSSDLHYLIKHGKRVYKMTKPDVQDNLSKPIFDALEGIFYEHDQQIVRITAEKVYFTRNCIVLELIELK